MKKNNFLKKIKLLLISVNQPTGAYITQAVVLYSLLILYIINEIDTFKFLMYMDLSATQITLKFAICALLLMGATVYMVKGIISYKK